MAKATLPEKCDNLQKLLTDRRQAIREALPKHLSVDRMIRISLTSLRTNPRLIDVAYENPLSFYGAVITAAQLGLEIDMLGQAFLVPYKKEIQLQIGYMGFLELIFRAGHVEPNPPVLVYAGETFEWQRGTNGYIRHVPSLEIEGKLVAGYMTWRWVKTGHEGFHVVPAKHINKVREFALSRIDESKHKFSPWITWPRGMEMKTVAIEVSKYIPRSPELTTAVQVEHTAAMGESQMPLSTEGYIDVPSETVKRATEETQEALRDKLGGGEPEETPELATDAQRDDIEMLLSTSTLNKAAQNETVAMLDDNPTYETAQGLINYLKEHQGGEKQEGLPV